MCPTTMHWYQDGSGGVTSWEFQYRPGGTDHWHWAIPVGPVAPCAECFEVPLDLPGGVAAVRARAIGPDGTSDWGSPTGVPEPPSILMFLVGLVALRFLGTKKKKPRGTGFPPSPPCVQCMTTRVATRL
jgi:hypothetical protein